MNNDKEPTDSMKEAAEIFSKHNRAVKMPETDTTTFRHMYYNFCYWLDDNNPFTRYVYVKSADEYMDMPRKKRTYLYFWYLDAIINDGHTILGRKSERDAIDNFHEYNFPFQYWLRENGFSLKCKLSRMYDWLRYKLNPRQKWLKKQIPDDWSDKVWLITELNFAMVVHFVDGEECFDNTDYEASGENHAKFANEFSLAASPPTILIFVPVTVPLNNAEPALEVVPIVIVSAATLPENVIIPGAPFALLIT
jgi:hypothetical protein